MLLNGSRLGQCLHNDKRTFDITGSAGFYEPFRRNLNKFIGRPVDEQIPFTSVIAGASSGAVGGMTEIYL